jgi:ABC-type sulfate transport system permease component
VLVYGQIESDAVTSAAAISVVLMLASLSILIAISYAGREVVR